MSARRICVLSAVYPTQEDPTRGSPVWATLKALSGKADLRVFCSVPTTPAVLSRVLKPRTYLRLSTGLHAEAATHFPAESLPFFFVPGITKPFNGHLLAREFEKKVRQCKPDVLLAYRVYPDGYAAVRTGERLGLPAVISSRGSDLKLLPSRGMVRKHTMYAVQRAAAVLCVSEDLARIARPIRSGTAGVHVVKNGIDAATFYPASQATARQRLRVAPHAKVVVFVGNLLPVKGVGHLIDALSKLEREQPREWLLVVVGEGNLHAELENKAVRAGVDARFVGAQSRPAVAEWLNASDIFCLPSISEGLPNVVIEAFACGRPVVGTTVGGIPELVEEGRTGFLVPPADPVALARALRRGAETQWDRNYIAAAHQVTWDQVANDTLQVCDDAVRSSRIHF